MRHCSAFVVFQILILLAGLVNPTLVGQSAGSGSGSPAIEVSLAVKKSLVIVGEKEVAVITVKNISSKDVSFPTYADNYRVHVKAEKGEPPLTQFHRHQRGVFLPGDNPMPMGGGVTLVILPGASDSKDFDLSNYYDLSTPGKYTIYMEYRDESEKWVRTNTVNFEIVAPPQ
jgi:hypothetical protein